MKILLVTQVFYPDTVSVSQHLWDLAVELNEKGHEVTVYSSKYAYEEKSKYLDYEIIEGVSIYRINQSKFGKSNSFFRIVDFFTFSVNITVKLLFLKKDKFDLIIGTTVPPMLSFIGILISKLNSIPFYYWIMDLQPELSIASGLIKKNSISANFFTFIGNYSIKNSEKIISLDRFMTDYLIIKGAKKSNIITIPVWPVLDRVYIGNRLENPFRMENNFKDKIVIMYSGNHAFVHPLDTLLLAARELKMDKRFLFVFVGGGVRKKDVASFKSENKLENIIQLPFQPRENIYNSLGSSDIQVVIMGENQVGFTHPNKIYGAMFIGKPILYIGPKESHVTDIISMIDGNILVEHNEYDSIVKGLYQFAEHSKETIENIGQENKKIIELKFSPEYLKRLMVDVITS